MTNAMLKIGHANVVSAPLHEVEIADLAQELDLDILCLNETRLSRHWTITGYESIQHNRNNRGGGVAMLIRSSLSFREIDLPPQFQQLEACLAEISLHGGINLMVCAVYSRPVVNLPLDFIRYLDTTYPCLLIAGDLNASSTNIGCPNDRKAAEFESIFDQTELIPLNLLDLTVTRHAHAGQINTQDSVLDWMLASPRLMSMLDHFLVFTDNQLVSDHDPIFACFKTAPIKDDEFVPQQVFVFSRADWPKYREVLDGLLHPLLNRLINGHLSLVQLNDEMVMAITTAADESIPKFLPRGPKKWWRFPPEAVDHKRQRNRHRRHAKTDDLLQRHHHRSWANYHQREMAEIIKREKAAGWQAFCAALSCRQDTRNFHKTFSTFKDGRLNPRKSLPKMKFNGQTAHTSQDKAQLCADYLGDVFQMPNGPEFDDNHRQMVDDTIQNLPQQFDSLQVPSRDPRAHALEEEVQPGEVSELVKKLRRGSPGPDGITNTLLKEGPQTLYVLMSKLFTASLDLGFLPDAWKEAHITMIPKHGKPRHTPANLRPISLLNTVGKVMERVIATRLRTHCEATGVFAQCQSGFRTGRSAYDHLLKLSEQGVTAIKKSKDTLAIFLDIQKAFDTVWHNGLRYRLHQLGLPARIVRWLSNFLSNRQLRTKVNHCLSNPFTANAGVPQGSVLSPLLYIIFARDMVPEETRRLAVAQFADDTSMWSTWWRHNPRPELQRGLNYVHQWCMKWRLVVNPAKSQLVCFTRRRDIIHRLFNRGNTQLKYGNTPIELSNSAKFLGVEFDKTLSLHAHCKAVRKRTYPMALLLRAFHARNWSVPIQSLLLIYKTHILPVLTYGSVSTISAHPRWRQQLQIVQNTALRSMLNQPAGICSRALHIYANIKTVDESLLHFAQRYYDKKARNSPLLEHQRVFRNYYLADISPNWQSPITILE